MGSRDAFFRCGYCGREYGLTDRAFRCRCGGLFDIAGLDDPFSASILDERAQGLFRYRQLMPSAVDGHWLEATMGEGWTAMVGLGKAFGGLIAKMDYAMPTLSFKDRGAAVLMAAAKAAGASSVIQDSSGNAGNSVAAYSARLGIECEIFVPEGTSPNKVSQIRAYGAKVRLVPGNREDTARAALEEAEAGRYYASHVYNPMFYQGTKTYIYEIWEQMGGSLPDALAVPVGNGTLLLGVYYGLKSLMAGGAISKMPALIAVQAARCAPLYGSFEKGLDSVAPVRNEGTLAEGIAIAAPMRGAQLIKAVRELGGHVVAVGEDEIKQAGEKLSRSGIFVEPTSAATVAGALNWSKASGFDGAMVVPMCGAGLKSLH